MTSPLRSRRGGWHQRVAHLAPRERRWLAVIGTWGLTVPLLPHPVIRSWCCSLGIVGFGLLGSRAVERTRRHAAFHLVVLACVLFAVGVMLSLVDGTSGRVLTAVRPTDLAWLGSLMALVAAANVTIWTRTPGPDRGTLLGDMTVGAATTFAVLWVFLVGPAVAGPLAPVAGVVVAYAVVISLHISTLFTLGVAAIRATRRPAPMVAAIALVTLLTAVLTGVLVRGGSSPDDPLVRLVAVLAAVGGVAVVLPPPPRVGRRAVRVTPALSRVRLGMLTLATAAASGALFGVERLDPSVRRVGTGSVGLALAAIAAATVVRVVERDRRRAADRFVAAVGHRIMAAADDGEVRQVVTGALTWLLRRPIDDVATDRQPSHPTPSAVATDDPLLDAVRDRGRRRPGQAATVSRRTGWGRWSYGFVVGDGTGTAMTFRADGVPSRRPVRLAEVVVHLATATLATRRRAAGLHQRRVAQHAKALVRWAGSPSLVLTDDGRMLAVSPQLGALLGWPEGQLTGLALDRLVVPADRVLVNDLLIDHTEPFDPVRIRRGIGGTIAVYLQCPAPLPGGGLLVSVVAHDADRPALASADRSTSLHRLAATVDRSPVAITVGAPDGGPPIYVNAAHLKLVVGEDGTALAQRLRVHTVDAHHDPVLAGEVRYVTCT